MAGSQLTVFGQQLAVKAARARRGLEAHGDGHITNGVKHNIPKAIQAVLNVLPSYSGTWEATLGPGGNYLFTCNGIGVCMINPSSFKVLTADGHTTKISLRGGEENALRSPDVVGKEISELIPPQAKLINNLNSLGVGNWEIRTDYGTTYIELDGKHVANINELNITSRHGQQTPSATLNSDGSNTQEVAELLYTIKLIDDALATANEFNRGWAASTTNGETTISFKQTPRFKVDKETNVLTCADNPENAGLTLKTYDNGVTFVGSDDLASILIDHLNQK